MSNKTEDTVVKLSAEYTEEITSTVKGKLSRPEWLKEVGDGIFLFGDESVIYGYNSTCQRLWTIKARRTIYGWFVYQGIELYVQDGNVLSQYDMNAFQAEKPYPENAVNLVTSGIWSILTDPPKDYETIFDDTEMRYSAPVVGTNENYVYILTGEGRVLAIDKSLTGAEFKDYRGDYKPDADKLELFLEEGESGAAISFASGKKVVVIDAGELTLRTTSTPPDMDSWYLSQRLAVMDQPWMCTGQEGPGLVESCVSKVPDGTLLFNFCDKLGSESSLYLLEASYLPRFDDQNRTTNKPDETSRMAYGILITDEKTKGSGPVLASPYVIKKDRYYLIYAFTYPSFTDSSRVQFQQFKLACTGRAQDWLDAWQNAWQKIIPEDDVLKIGGFDVQNWSVIEIFFNEGYDNFNVTVSRSEEFEKEQVLEKAINQGKTLFKKSYKGTPGGESYMVDKMMTEFKTRLADTLSVPRSWKDLWEAAVQERDLIKQKSGCFYKMYEKIARIVNAVTERWGELNASKEYLKSEIEKMKALIGKRGYLIINGINGAVHPAVTESMLKPWEDLFNCVDEFCTGYFQIYSGLKPLVLVSPWNTWKNAARYFQAEAS